VAAGVDLEIIALDQIQQMTNGEMSGWLGGTMLNGMEQRGIHAGEAGEHLGVAPVALALVAGDGVELAGIGHDDGGPEAGEVTADPRAVRARLQRDGGAGKLREELRQGRAGVGQGRLADDVAGGIEHADVMRPITEIEAEGEPADGSRRGGGNDGGSSFSFHRQSISPDASLRRMSAFSSNLVSRHRANILKKILDAISKPPMNAIVLRNGYGSIGPINGPLLKHAM